MEEERIRELAYKKTSTSLKLGKANKEKNNFIILNRIKMMD
jgi:hypothetical protein